MNKCVCGVNSTDINLWLRKIFRREPLRKSETVYIFENTTKKLLKTIAWLPMMTTRMSRNM